MPFDPESQELRRRAAHLRQVASAIDAVRLDEVAAWAGPDTWRSPGAERCRAMLDQDRHRLLHAADELRERASHFDREADACDALAAVRLVT